MKGIDETRKAVNPRRKRLRLTLGGMMIVVMIFAGWLGWIVRQATIQRDAVATIIKAGGEVVYDYQWEHYDAKPRGPKWWRSLIGSDYFDTVYGVSADKPKVDDAVVAQIGRLTHVRWLGLQGSTVTDAGLVNLAGLHELRVLHLRSANVTGSGFRHLVGLRKLYSLQFNQTPITDGNLRYVAAISSIEKLGFHHTSVTDNGMKSLTNMKSVREIWLSKTDVGDDGLRELGRIQRPMLIHVRAQTRITPAGIESMKSLAPSMTITP